MCIRETARELAMKDAQNRQRPGFTTDNVRFNNETGLLQRTKKRKILPLKCVHVVSCFLKKGDKWSRLALEMKHFNKFSL